MKRFGNSFVQPFCMAIGFIGSSADVFFLKKNFKSKFCGGKNNP